MDSTTIAYIIKNKRYPNSIFKTILISIVYLLFIIVGFSISFNVIIEALTTNILKENNMFGFIIFFSLILLSYSILIILFFQSEINSFSKFEEIIVSKEQAEITTILKEKIPNYFTLSHIETHNNNFIIFETLGNFLTYGEKISIIINENLILVNSKSNKFQLFTYGTHKRNINKIRDLFNKNKNT